MVERLIALKKYHTLVKSAILWAEGLEPGDARYATAEEIAFFSSSTDYVMNTDINNGDLVYVIIDNQDGGRADCIVGLACKPEDQEYARLMAPVEPYSPEIWAWEHCADDLVLILKSHELDEAMRGD